VLEARAPRSPSCVAQPSGGWRVNALCTCQGLMSGGSEERAGKEGGAAGQPPTLRAQLEFFFSEENISHDPLLRSSLDKDGCAPPRPAAPPPGEHVLRRGCELPAPPSISCELRTAKCDRSGPGGACGQVLRLVRAGGVPSRDDAHGRPRGRAGRRGPRRAPRSPILRRARCQPSLSLYLSHSTLNLSHTHSLTHFLSHTHSLTHSHTPHSLSHSLSLSHTHTHCARRRPRQASRACSRRGRTAAWGGGGRTARRSCSGRRHRRRLHG
jgi:hypothetical protein